MYNLVVRLTIIVTYSLTAAVMSHDHLNDYLISANVAFKALYHFTLQELPVVEEDAPVRGS